MKHTIQLLGITLFGAAVLVACGDDSVTGGSPAGGSPPVGGNPPEGGNPPGGGNGGEGGNGGAPPAFPPPPELGAQIDRMGRPAINTALTGAFVQFNGAGNKVAANSVVRAGLQDDYNQDTAQADWADTYGTLFAANLAILDALDTGLDLGAGIQTNAQACTNQFGSLGSLSDPDNYDLLGGFVLPNDRLWMNTGGTDCSAESPASPLEGYLAVELDAQGAPLENTGCGGRRPIDDVIQTTYSAVAIGGIAGFDDGIAARPGQHPATFPYLASPQ